LFAINKMKFSLIALASVAGTGHAFVFVPQQQKAFARAAPLSATVDAPTTSRKKTKAPIFDEVCETTGVTLTRFMNEVATLNPELRELTTLFGAIDTACKAISNLVKRSQLPSGRRPEEIGCHN
jgi:hypothetical protein